MYQMCRCMFIYICTYVKLFRFNKKDKDKDIHIGKPL